MGDAALPTGFEDGAQMMLMSLEEDGILLFATGLRLTEAGILLFATGLRLTAR